MASFSGIRRLLAAVPLLFASGCIPLILEFSPVGTYGPKPTCREIFEETKTILRQRGFRVAKADRSAWRIETAWYENPSVREQIRVVLQPDGKLTHVWVLGVMNENLSSGDFFNPAARAWGPDEKATYREHEVRMLLDRRLKELAGKP